MTPEYKAEKEASVSYLGGGNIWEINLVTLVAPAAALCWSILQKRQGVFKPYTVSAAVADFLLNCCAILFATTVYAGQPQTLNGFLILPTVAAMLQPPAAKEKTAKPPPKSEPNGKPAEPHDQNAGSDLDPLPVKPFITTYRGAMMVVTCASILAVDFPIFPRRFAKTESYGTSLMDMGVGSFVFAAGMVAARQQLKEQHSASRSITARLKASMRHALPLFVLGLIRLWTVKGLDYAEHVSEYGVHWNFFFTLALLSPAIAILQPLLRVFPSYGLLAFLIGICIEIFYESYYGIKAYIILSERIPGDWLSQNREGVFSFAGYLAIFIGGMGAGMGILPRDVDPEEKRKQEKAKAAEKDSMDEDAEWLASVLAPDQQKPAAKPVSYHPLKPEYPQTTFFHLVKWTGIWFILAVWAMWLYGPGLFVSRRMANLAYVIWVCAFNSAQLLLFCSIESWVFPKIYDAKDKATEKQRVSDATSTVMKAFNRNGLALFLLANLLTGLVNMSMETLHMGDTMAMVVLVGYMGVLCAVALALERWDVSIKL
ncbi:Glucosaminyl phosphatidylinositol (GlcN-PI) nositol acylation protein [Saxophila tyrrhenica]|uniref:GPI-anchored wall transfer protein n=1 Tax=Saxophila tyrrhenica TaxID=1690608 RepID=A0AAV9PC22_9PEZI|nr:Glucosaminyl phosphatidylinositol (GlcN-PI) nositol acylation protein [Saxophila tyrrhenica]